MMKLNQPKLITGLTGLLLLFSTLLQAQTVVDSALLDRISALEKQNAERRPGEDHFLVVGLATFGFVSNKTTNTFNGVSDVTKTNSWDADHFEFSPLFLWRHGKKVLLEFEPSYAGGSLGVNWADVSYFAAPGLILRAGYLVLPFGIYNKRLAAGWINKLATDPIGVPDMPPLSDYGVEVEGGFQAGTMKWNYDLAISNGHQLLNDGTLQTAGLIDNNKNKTITGRVGWLPFENSSLEVGTSFMRGKVGDAGSMFENLKASMYAFDLNFVKNIRPFLLNIKGQYNTVKIDAANYIKPMDPSGTYTYNNLTQSGFIQASLRPVYVDNALLKKLEFAVRYGNYKTPKYSVLGSTSNAFTFGLNYWMTWRTVVRVTYEGIKGDDTSSNTTSTVYGTKTKSNSFYVQFAISL